MVVGGSEERALSYAGEEHQWHRDIRQQVLQVE
jgi:hypothetical protein